MVRSTPRNSYARFWRIAAASLGLAVLTPLQAQKTQPVRVAALFSDGTVLQRDRPIPVWGEAGPGADLLVKFRSQSVSAKADADGRWKTSLAPEPAGGPDSLTVVSGNDSLSIRDVLVGEVWLAAGQSNMLFKLGRVQPPLAEIPEDPEFRFFRVPQKPADAPLTDTNGSWRAPSEEVSAVAYFFGRQLREKLDVPVGIIVSAVGGTPISAWISPSGANATAGQPIFEAEWKEVLEGYPAKRRTYDEARAAWEEKKKLAEARGEAFPDPAPREPLGPDSVKRPYCLFNGMIHPLAPYSVRGILWYQGESDAGGKRIPYYLEMLRALIGDWRGRWDDPSLPFLIIQLPAFQQDLDWVHIREAQQTVARDPGNGLVVTLDAGEEKDVHPVNKEPVGKRAGNLALADVYGLKVPAHAPRAVSAKRVGDAVHIAFTCDENAKLACRPASDPAGIEIAGADGKFVPAQAHQDGNRLIVSTAGMAEPARVRYAWAAWTPVSIYDSHGLPATQFSLPVESGAPAP